MKSICRRRTEGMIKAIGWILGFAAMISMGIQAVA